MDIHSMIAKYLPQEVKRPQSYQDHIIEVANLNAPIHLVLQELFSISVPEFSTSWKITCPYGSEHPDGGKDRNCRVYSASNTVYCFAQHYKMSPVFFYWRQYDHKNLFEAAKHIIIDYELQPPEEDYRERYKRILEGEFKSPVLSIFEPLQVLLADDMRYKRNQFKPEILSLINQTSSETPFEDPIQATRDLYAKITQALERLEPK